MDGKTPHRRWLNHRRELTGPDGSAAVLARRLHPTQQPERIMSKYQKSHARNGREQYAPVRIVEEFYELVDQGRPEDIDVLMLWLRQQASRARGGQLPGLMELMQMEQEADGRDDPLQLKLAGGDWSVAPEVTERLMDQAARSEMLARRIDQRWRERRAHA